MTYLLDALHARVGEFVALRRDIHRHPELAFDEHQTARYIADLLRSWGYEVSEGVGKTGVVARLHCGTGTKSIGLRADTDALAV